MSIEITGNLGNIPNDVRLSELRANKTEQKEREWTKENLRVVPEPEDSFMQDEIRQKNMTEKFKQSQKQKANFDINQGFKGIVTPEEFKRRDKVIITHENSTVLSPDKSGAKSSNRPPKAMLLDENGKLVETNLPADVQDIKQKMGMNIWKTTANPNKKATVGSFNIEWLGMKERSEDDYKAIAQVIKDTGAQVLGIEEIANVEGLKRVLKHLPDFGYILGKSGQQMVGVIFDKNRVKYDKSSIDQLENITLNKKGLRPPLKVYMQVDKFDFTFVVMHLKAGFDERALDIRSQQSKLVNRWLSDHLSKESDKDLIIVGDYNDFVDSDALKTINKGNKLEYVTQGEEEKGMYSNIRYKNVIDHGAVSSVEGGANEEYIRGSVRTIDESKYDHYSQSISDHKPVVFDVQSGIDRD